MQVLDSAWRGAEAYHFYILAQRQLYEGLIELSMRTAIRCSEFEDVLEPYDIFSLIALAAYHCGYFGVCSKAFVKLETLHTTSGSTSSTDAMSSISSSSSDSTTQQQQQQHKADVIQTLAVNIFTKHPPLDKDPLEQQLRDCLIAGKPFQACTVTGQLITSKTRVLCRLCIHASMLTDRPWP
jgi:WD repeat-containing protein 35